MTTIIEPAGQPLAALSIEALSVDVVRRSGAARRVLDDVNLALAPGERLGIIGEGGSGKSLLARSVLGILDRRGRVVGGRILFHGQDLLSISRRELEEVRGRHIALVPQDASRALTPVYPIGAQLVEVVRQHFRGSKKAAYERSIRALGRAGLGEAERVFRSYPHELSGGMKQRVAIALALVCEPEIIIADDPTSALDVTIQAQLLWEFVQLVRSTGVSLVFISNDLRVVALVCDRIAVLYAGQVCEIGSPAQIRDSGHPYTRALVRCAPSVDERIEPLPTVAGRGAIDPMTVGGCRFHPRCGRAGQRCSSLVPALTAVSKDHVRACWNPEF